MASVIDICNRALANLGDDASVASIDPPEGSAQAEHCARFYPIARDTLLEMHNWSFATKRVRLALLDVDSWNWSYAYAKPNGIIRALAIVAPNAAVTAESQPFDIEGDAILTNLNEAVLRYTERISDTTKFSPSFTDALTWLLASYLVGPVLKGDAGAAMARTCLQSFTLALSNAKVSDANQRKIASEHSPAWIAGR